METLMYIFKGKTKVIISPKRDYTGGSMWRSGPNADTICMI